MKSLYSLASALIEHRTEAEVCVVGGAVLRFAFQPRPSTRHPRALFAPPEALEAAEAQVGKQFGLPRSWLDTAAREVCTRNGSPTGGFFEAPGLSVVAPPAEYALAMSCLALEWSTLPTASVERDIGYLLRYLGMEEAPTALERVSRYMSDAQRPEHLEQRLRELL